MDGRGCGPRRGIVAIVIVVSRCGDCCRRAAKMERIKREDIPRAVVLALAGRPTSRPSCFGRNAPAVASATAALSSSPSAAPGSSNAPRRSTSATLCGGFCVRTRLFLFLPSRHSHGSRQAQAGYTITAVSIPLFIRLPCYPHVVPETPLRF